MNYFQPKFKIHIVPLEKVSEHVNECVDVLAIIDRVDECTQVRPEFNGIGDIYAKDTCAKLNPKQYDQKFN